MLDALVSQSTLTIASFSILPPLSFLKMMLHSKLKPETLLLCLCPFSELVGQTVASSETPLTPPTTCVQHLSDWVAMWTPPMPMQQAPLAEEVCDNADS